jgi:hypothetical protein
MRNYVGKPPSGSIMSTKWESIATDFIDYWWESQRKRDH